MDVHVKAAITAGLRQRGIDVLTAQEDGANRLDDDRLLERATALQRVLFSQDDDLLVIVKPINFVTLVSLYLFVCRATYQFKSSRFQLVALYCAA
jgi:hypothetical protein